MNDAIEQPIAADDGMMTARRVARNSLSPLLAQLLTKVIDTFYAIVVLRLLGDQLNGSYAWGGVILLYATTLTSWGLDVLLIREVARDRAQANRYFSHTLLLRLGLSLAILPILALLLLPNPRLLIGDEVRDVGATVAAVFLLAFSLLPTAVAAAATSVFQAFEQMQAPALVSVATALIKAVPGGVLFILYLAGVIQPGAGWLLLTFAALPLFVNCFTAAILYFWMRRDLLKPRLEWDGRFAVGLLSMAWPLLLNSLLVGLFFKFDFFILQKLDADALGRYAAAYTVINFFPLITANLTYAVFPIFSQRATDPVALGRAYGKTLKLLLLLAAIATVLIYMLAGSLMWLFAGPNYLPQAGQALQILILFLPLSFFNGLTQYVLIALGQQRYLTPAFVLVTIFNIGANLLLIPQFGFYAAAWVTVASEVVLMIPIYLLIRRSLAGAMPNLLALAWRPALAAVVVGGVAWLLLSYGLPGVLVAAAGLLYPPVLLILNTFSPDERAIFSKLLRRGK